MSTSGGSSGGSTAGALIYRKFPFAFNTAGILTGHTVYTPTVGDLLHDVWVSITTAWDGTTPMGDVGPFVAETIGAYNETVPGPVDMTKVDKSDGSNMPNTWQSSGGNGLGGPHTLSVAYLESAISAGLPIRFTTADPIKVCVSQNGHNNGADPAPTQGAAVVYLITSTPT